MDTQKEVLFDTSQSSINSRMSLSSSVVQIQQQNNGIDFVQSILLVIGFVITLRATNMIVYLWNMLITIMAQLINTTILFSEPVPECIQHKKRMVFGSVLQLIFLAAIMYIKYYKKTELNQLKLFMTIDVVLMEGIFMYRLGISFYHFMLGPSSVNQATCEVNDRHIKAFLAPYYVLIMMRFVIYFLLAKYTDQIYNNVSSNESKQLNGRSESVASNLGDNKEFKFMGRIERSYSGHILDSQQSTNQRV